MPDSSPNASLHLAPLPESVPALRVELRGRSVIEASPALGAMLGAAPSEVVGRPFAELVGAGDRFDSVDERPSTKMDGYVLFNLLATYSIARNWSMELRWNNVFNERYELAKGYNTPSSNVFVSVQYTLQ